MFIWDFIAETVLGQIIDWIYGQIVGFLDDSLMQMGSTGADLPTMSQIQSIVLSFSYLVRALYVTGLVVVVLKCGIDYQAGRGSMKETALNAIRGFLAVSLFTTAPVELRKSCVSLQGSFTAGITGLGDNLGAVAAGITNFSEDAGTWEAATTSGVFDGLANITSPVLIIFTLILMGYATVKVFFADLKQGGILLIQIAIDSLHMFSVPRGYVDGLASWSKQIISLCLTTFLRAAILVAGLMVIRDQALLGLGLTLSAGKTPRIAGQFGPDTTTRASMMGTVYAAQGTVNLTRTIVQTVVK